MIPEIDVGESSMLDLYIEQSGKRLRCGYTTGSCAAAAAKAAAQLLLTGTVPKVVSLDTPKGILLTLDVLEPVLTDGQATCAIRKDSGDDPDITNGILVYATVFKIAEGIVIDGGQGVGRVTKPGLNQPVGAAAINSTPRQMIADGLHEIAASCGYTGGFSVVISIPQGEALAKRTFNPRIGIVGGISVIGTTGIVEPMSNAALVDTIRLELNVQAEAGETAVMLTPGNYGEDFTRDRLKLDTVKQVTCSNFIGDAIDAAIKSGFTKILLIGHIGKLVKLGIGMFNTHSQYGDGRMETLVSCALTAGADLRVLRAVSECIATDAALAILHHAGVLEDTMKVLGERIHAALVRRVPEGVEIGFVCFTNEEKLRGILTMSDNAEEMMKLWRHS